MEILEHLFICSPSYLDTEDDNSELLNQKDVTTELIERLSVQPFHFSAPQVALSLADRPLSLLQASEWSSFGKLAPFLYSSTLLIVLSPVGFSEESNSPHLELYSSGL
ncbi:hypothetical protein RhiirB3_437645 [Rhizophagus irregularis]|nr:hypothetical protein RhiirB3_437645 [Rhizophagus irregularis]